MNSLLGSTQGTFGEMSDGERYSLSKEKQGKPPSVNTWWGTFRRSSTCPGMFDEMTGKLAQRYLVAQVDYFYLGKELTCREKRGKVDLVPLLPRPIV